jgi:hypothetical protein
VIGEGKRMEKKRNDEGRREGEKRCENKKRVKDV